MSYASMDHAAWVQANITAHKRHKPTFGERRALDAHKGWHAAPDELTPFQRRAFTILGNVGGGIYNAPIAWKAVEWAPTFLVVPWRNSLSTTDFDDLSRLVLMAHDAAIRVDVSPAMRHLRLMLHERRPRLEGDGYHRGHPSIDEALVRHRALFPAGHWLHHPQAPLAARPEPAADAPTAHSPLPTAEPA